MRQSHRKETLKAIVAGYIVFLFLQLMFRLFVQEPFPAIVYPSFAGPLGDQKYYIIKKPVFITYTSQHDTLHIGRNKVLAEYPGSFRGDMMSRITSILNAFSGQQVDYLKRNKKSFRLGNWQYTITRKLKPDKISDSDKVKFKKWLKNRLSNIAGDDVKQCRLAWYKVYYSKSESSKKVKKELTNSLTVKF